MDQSGLNLDGHDMVQFQVEYLLASGLRDKMGVMSCRVGYNSTSQSFPC